ncbi:hypothetical protein BC829DRAFT_388164 [Chytridium lagenaria]|nr:hypothetical protein BC829DRAFT_388164 [Chytridium lagenaria]
MMPLLSSFFHRFPVRFSSIPLVMYFHFVLLKKLYRFRFWYIFFVFDTFCYYLSFSLIHLVIGSPIFLAHTVSLSLSLFSTFSCIFFVF